jgi:tetraacyldisaccharide 4'-kinase
VVVPEDLEEGLLHLIAKPVWRIRRGISVATPPASAVAFCGIARPERFFTQLLATGVRVLATKSYRDHHSYTPRDIRELRSLQKQSGADAFVTTEKDRINLGPLLSELRTVAVAQVTMQLVEPADALDTILRAIANKKSNA